METVDRFTLRAQNGKEGEQLTATAYCNAGYHILEQNYHTRWGEVDIVAEKDGLLVIIEVKTRKTNAMVTGAEAVDIHKQRKLVKATLHYISAHFKQEPFVRFDVAEVCIGKAKPTITIIENAFTL